MALKDIFATLEIRDKSIIYMYLYQSTTERSRHFTRVLFSRNFAYESFIFTKLRIYAKFRENKTLAKISELKVFIVRRVLFVTSSNMSNVSKRAGSDVVVRLCI